MSDKTEACGGSQCATIPPASITGRVAKFMMGALQLQLVYTLVLNGMLVGVEQMPRNSMLWVAIILAYALISWTVNLGFGRAWGAKPAAVAVLLTAVAALATYVLYGAVWGPPFALAVASVAVYVHGHMGLSHVLAAIMGTAGCEMRVIPQIWSRINGSDPNLVLCPGIWTRIDLWEANLRNRTVEN